MPVTFTATVSIVTKKSKVPYFVAFSMCMSRFAFTVRKGTDTLRYQ